MTEIVQFTMNGHKSSDYPEPINSGEQKPSSSRRAWVFVLTSVLLLSTAVFFSMFLVYYFKYQNREINNECTTLDCVQTASMLVKKMDLSVDPCEDFDRFACGNFYRTIYLRDDQTSLHALTTLMEDTSYILKSILHEETKEGDYNYKINMKNLYKSCMDEDGIEEIGVKPYLDTPQAKEWPTLIGQNWPQEATFDLNDVVTRYMRIGIEPIFAYQITPDPMNSSLNILEIIEPGTGLSREYLVKPRNNTVILAYEKYLVETAKVFGANASVAAEDVKALVDLQVEIAKIKATSEDKKVLSNMYNPTTLGQLGRNFSYIDMPRGIRAAFDMVNITVDDDQAVNLAFPTFYVKLEEILKKADKRVLMNKLGFAHALRHTTGLTKRLRKIQLELLKVIMGISELSERWEICQGQVESVFSLALSKDYTLRRFSEESKEYVNEMVDNLEDAFRDQLRDADWMSHKTRQEAYAKLEKMTRKIGYPDKKYDYEDLEEKYKNYTMLADNNYENMNTVFWNSHLQLLKSLRKPVDKDKWKMAPHDTNAYYSVSDNEVVFLAGVLQPPLFSKFYPDYLNYGAIGYMIGHEITHGFDDEGRQFDQDGTFRDWWQKEDMVRYLDNCECFVQQYGNFRDHTVGMNVSGINTLSENVADNGGLEASYNAYKKLVKEKGEGPRLPGLGLTDDQLFFLGYAQIHCEKATKESILLDLQFDVHSPGRFRTIGVVQNSPDFAKAYNCPVGSPMNPENKCSVW